jgi:hypothetical protein
MHALRTDARPSPTPGSPTGKAPVPGTPPGKSPTPGKAPVPGTPPGKSPPSAPQCAVGKQACGSSGGVCCGCNEKCILNDITAKRTLASYFTGRDLKGAVTSTTGYCCPLAALCGNNCCGRGSYCYNGQCLNSAARTSTAQVPAPVKCKATEKACGTGTAVDCCTSAETCLTFKSGKSAPVSSCCPRFQ